jgi:hypothetical protein
LKRQWLFASLLLASSLSCSLLVGGEPEPTHCTQEGRRGPPACELGYRCRSGICQADAVGGGGPHDAGALAGAGGGS